MAYRFIEENHHIFGVRWLLRRMHIYPNAYYNYLKHRKADRYVQKEKIKAQITSIYHSHDGVDGYRQMKVYLERLGIHLSRLTVHRYMNKELNLISVVRRKNQSAPMARKPKTTCITRLVIHAALLSHLFASRQVSLFPILPYWLLANCNNPVFH